MLGQRRGGANHTCIPGQRLLGRQLSDMFQVPGGHEAHPGLASWTTGGGVSVTGVGASGSIGSPDSLEIDSIALARPCRRPRRVSGDVARSGRGGLLPGHLPRRQWLAHSGRSLDPLASRGSRYYSDPNAAAANCRANGHPNAAAANCRANGHLNDDRRAPISATDPDGDALAHNGARAHANAAHSPSSAGRDAPLHSRAVRRPCGRHRGCERHRGPEQDPHWPGARYTHFVAEPAQRRRSVHA